MILYSPQNGSAGKLAEARLDFASIVECRGAEYLASISVMCNEHPSRVYSVKVL